MGKTFFNIVATFSEFEADLIRMRTREDMATAKACKGKVARETAKTVGKTTERALANARYRGIFDQRSCRGLLRITTDRLSNIEQAKIRSTYDFAPYRNRPRLGCRTPPSPPASRSWPQVPTAGLRTPGCRSPPCRKNTHFGPFSVKPECADLLCAIQLTIILP